jgi:hypothetical protein
MDTTAVSTEITAPNLGARFHCVVVCNAVRTWILVSESSMKSPANKLKRLVINWQARLSENKWITWF